MFDILYYFSSMLIVTAKILRARYYFSILIPVVVVIVACMWHVSKELPTLNIPTTIYISWKI
jgi:hypothetical protein